MIKFKRPQGQPLLLGESVYSFMKVPRRFQRIPRINQIRAIRVIRWKFLFHMNYPLNYEFLIESGQSVESLSYEKQPLKPIKSKIKPIKQPFCNKNWAFNKKKFEKRVHYLFFLTYKGKKIKVSNLLFFIYEANASQNDPTTCANALCHFDGIRTGQEGHAEM